MDFQNFLPSHNVRTIHDHMTSESSRAKKSRIQYFGSIGSRHDDHAGIGVESVHFGEQLIQGLLLFVVSSHGIDPTGLTQGIQLIDEDDARSMVLSLRKEIPDPGRADSDKHLDEIRTADREKGNVGLSRHGP